MTILPSALELLAATFITLGWLGMLERRVSVWDAVGDPVGDAVCLAVRVCPFFCMGLSTSNSLTSIR
jgi:hypothetical protein